MESKSQLELSFDKSANRLKARLEGGDFTLFFEIDPPDRDCDVATATARLAPFVAAVNAVEGLSSAVAVTDRRGGTETYNVADFAAKLLPEDRDKHLLFVSGRGAKGQEVKDTLAGCLNYGFMNIVAVTGDALPPAAGGRRCEHVDSLDILKLAVEGDRSPTYAGCACSPFKYVPASSYSQYFKLMKKFSYGASFVVAQAGWDLIKHQELRWYLESRDCFCPSLARVALLTPERAARIAAGAYPGVYLSPDHQAILSRESRFSEAQFMAAQWRRLQFMVAGLRLLGYSGVVISGADKPQWILTAGNKIAEALKEFPDFHEWRAANDVHMARAEMAPYPYRFYVFENLFSEAYASTPIMSRTPFEPCVRGEKLRRRLSELLLASAAASGPGKSLFLKKFLAGCPGCPTCRLPLTQYVCPELCPKGLANGPCGGSKANGECETRRQECVHSKITRLANWTRQLPSLEECYIPPVN